MKRTAAFWFLVSHQVPGATYQYFYNDDMPPGMQAVGPQAWAIELIGAQDAHDRLVSSEFFKQPCYSSRRTSTPICWIDVPTYVTWGANAKDWQMTEEEWQQYRRVAVEHCLIGVGQGWFEVLK